MRRSLLQAYINRDEAPNIAEIDKQMVQQRLEFHRLLEEKLAQLKAAREYWDRPHLSPEETKEVKEIYKTLVKRLHPDLNPHYTEAVSYTHLSLSPRRLQEIRRGSCA